MPSKSPLAAVWKALTKMLARHDALQAWSGARLAAIEDRLAALDGGPDADSARHKALDVVNGRRAAKGQKPLGMGIVGTGNAARIEWTSSETRGDQ